MKKYIITCFVVALILGIYYYIENYTSISFFSHTKITTNITTKGKDIYLNNKKFNIKAINLGSYKKGSDDADYSIKETDYNRWFKQGR